jgi:DNA polymerase-1
MAAGLPVPNGDRLFDVMHADQLLHAGLYSPKGTFMLAAIAERRLGMRLDKQEQTSDWSGPVTAEQLTYMACDASVLLPLKEKLSAALADAGLQSAAAIESRVQPATTWLEYTGAPFAAQDWQVLSDAAAAERERIRQELDQCAGTSINWNAPMQVVKLLRQRGYAIGSSVSDEVLEALDPNDPLVQRIREYRVATKNATTYGIAFLAHVHPKSGRIHSHYDQLRTATGRWSSSGPNLQNIPRDPRHRACFTPPVGRVLVKGDLSQIEARVMARFSGDATLCAAYQQDHDVHLLMAIRLKPTEARALATAAFGAPPETTAAQAETLLLQQGAKAVMAAAPAWKGYRQLAKSIVFGQLYGAGAARLREQAAKSYGVTMTEAEAAQFREQFFQTFPDVRRWQREQGNRTNPNLAADALAAAYDEEPAHSLHEARRRREALAAAREAQGPALDTRTLTNRRRLGVEKYTEKINGPVQGTAADICKLGLALLWETRHLHPSAAPVLCVHDEIVLEVDAADADATAVWLRECMESAGNQVLQTVPVVAEVEVMADWSGTPVTE